MTRPLHERTPLLESRPLSAALGQRVLLKLEALQPVGSFKIRGIGALAQQLVAGGARRLVSSSGGNAGLAAAYAGRMLGVETLVVVPSTTPLAMRARIAAEGARVVEHGSAWDEAHAFALGLAREAGSAYVHPFDDPRIWRGHATLVEELAEQCARPGLLVVAVGGGGLLCGILEGLECAGWGELPVLAVETEGAASCARSLAAGQLVELDAIRTIAVTLGAKRVAQKVLEWSARRPIESLVVSDRSALDALERFAADHRLLVEPACAAALAPVYERAPALRDRGPVLVVVCGGAGVSLELVREWRERVG